MIAFPNAKINLGLNVLSKRTDGYHNISSCFYPIQWSDVLEIIPSRQFQFSSSGLEIAGSIENNLCVKAFDLLTKDYILSPVHIHLHKVIPMGAGLGGGSSDAAFTLKMLNEMFKLDIGISELQQYASQLGSDCTFFIENKPTLVSGVGDELEVLDFNLEGFKLLVVYPDIHVSTQNAYNNLKLQSPEYSMKDLLNRGIDSFKEGLKNDFEVSVGVSNPEIIQIKEKLYKLGARYASMTGSGSAVYGIFDSKKSIGEASKHFDECLTWIEGL